MHVPCDFTSTRTPDGFRLICNRCGTVRTGTGPTLVRRCDVRLATPAKPRTSAKSTPRQRWLAAGRPIRSPEEIDGIVMMYCEVCRHFVAKSRGCRLCCRDSLRKLKLPARLRMKTEGCPAKPAKWRAET